MTSIQHIYPAVFTAVHQTAVRRRKPVLKVRTQVKAGGMTFNHNQTAVRRA